MTLPARAAAVRGDDYQHTIGWAWAAQMLTDPDIESVEVEAPNAGAFDDIVVRRRQAPDIYIQSKSSNHGDVVISTEWLTTAAAPKGRSPLKHFFDTWESLTSRGAPFDLELWTNRTYDPDNPILGKARDLKDERVDTAQILEAGTRSHLGRERDLWREHLNVDLETLIGFLSAVAWRQSGSETVVRDRAKQWMRLAELQYSDAAADIGVSLVRSWVTDGVGSVDAETLRAQVAAKHLQALEGRLLLVVNAIDRIPTPAVPNEVLDFVKLFDGDHPRRRKLLLDQDEWGAAIEPQLEEAELRFRLSPIRHVHVDGALRLPMWFAVGHSFPQVRRWTLSADQVDGSEWSTTDEPTPVDARTIAERPLGLGSDVVGALALTSDLTDSVDQYVRTSALPASLLQVFGPNGAPSPSSVPSGGWTMGWTRSVREQLRASVRNEAARHLHLFIAGPAGAAMMLGHQWNLMPATTLYEYVDGTYAPFATIRSTR